jgi:hypothetical protein
MKPTIAIVESEVARQDAAVDAAFAGFKRSREEFGKRRLALGESLVAVRGRWPRSGPRARAWGEYLAARGIDQDVALDAMAYAGYLEENPPNVPGELPTSREAGIDKRPLAADRAAPLFSLVPDPDPEVGIDRDTWCTPPWLTEPLGRFDLDPCGNGRSQVRSATQFILDLGIDGLLRGEDVQPDWRVFINPPYSDVGPWIAAYKHTRFCFLLKLDTSTKWFAELHAATALILIPRRRVNFIPPPGVPPDKAVAQQFPHALFYAHADDATDAIRALCWSWRVDH